MKYGEIIKQLQLTVSRSKSSKEIEAVMRLLFYRITFSNCFIASALLVPSFAQNIYLLSNFSVTVLN
jgi:hypothetical protein